MNASNNVSVNTDEISGILLDIEGTITSVDFVRKNLFVHVEKHISSFVKKHWNDEFVQEVFVEFLNQKLLEQKAESTDNFVQDSFITKLLFQMEINQKTPAMKKLEGLVCKQGFINKEIVGHIYPDVVEALATWKKQGKKVFIFSNGSVDSQRLLFKYSMHGDLMKFIDGYFDTTIGSKFDSTTYSELCQEIKITPNEMLFISDHPKELLAAKQSGLNIILVVRDPDQPMFLEDRSYLTSNDPLISSFSEITKGKE